MSQVHPANGARVIFALGTAVIDAPVLYFLEGGTPVIADGDGLDTTPTISATYHPDTEVVAIGNHEGPLPGTRKYAMSSIVSALALANTPEVL